MLFAPRKFITRTTVASRGLKNLHNMQIYTLRARTMLFIADLKCWKFKVDLLMRYKCMQLFYNYIDRAQPRVTACHKFFNYYKTSSKRCPKTDGNKILLQKFDTVNDLGQYNSLENSFLKPTKISVSSCSFIAPNLEIEVNSLNSELVLRHVIW